MVHETPGIHEFFASLSAPSAFFCVMPFFLMLLSIAVFPLVAPGFWDKNRNKGIVAAIFALPSVIFFMVRDWNILAKTVLEYGAFIGLLGALFVISGGIYIRGSFKGKPQVNMFFLAIGAVLANVVGTTGASMLLIRPLLRANHERRYKVHTVIFFIFIVSNCGGILTPLGDPPLFLGFLKGVTFGWTFRLFPTFLFVNVILVLVYYFIDRYFFKRESDTVKEAENEAYVLSESFGIEGRRNFVLLIALMLTSLFSGYVLYRLRGPDVFGEPFGTALAAVVQITAFTLLAVISYGVTPKNVHERNNFHFHPIIEVGVRFSGIFASMIPVLLILEEQGAKLGVHQAWQFFWFSGGLSSFLDNAPTYLTFTSLAKGVFHIGGAGLGGLMSDPAGGKVLAAISCGAVFMGANTYIGNGPNFMVKAIAEHSGVKMPGFFAYMLWSLCILIPLFIAVTFIFFRGTC
ncbi:MAG: sodium:proton antiporter [Candidatus Omnitrophica bacterium]|nr:sodium:proton antiporter [Candidatus Omnitrophota bacterium]